MSIVIQCVSSCFTKEQCVYTICCTIYFVSVPCFPPLEVTTNEKNMIKIKTNKIKDTKKKKIQLMKSITIKAV